MKVALCFGGQPRYITQTYPYWKNCVLDKYNPDVFVHTWHDPNIQTNGFNQSRLQDQLNGLYQPKMLVIDSPKTFDVSIYTDRVWPHRTTPNGVLSQWYSVCHSLKQRKAYEMHNKFSYDIVVRARFDWYLRSIDFEINTFWNIASTPTLDGHRFRLRGQEFVGINDQFGYGSSNTADLMAGIFDHIPYLYQNEQVDFCSELLLKAHLELGGIQVQQHAFHNGMVRWWGVNP